MNRSQIASKLKGQIKEFSGKLCRGLPKVVGRFVEEMLYGILCGQSVHVAKIARTLNERIRLIKTINPALGGATGEAGVRADVEGQADRGGRRPHWKG
jgi:hypothetical protein